MKRIVLAAAIVALAGTAAIAAAGEKAYVDSTGDSGSAPDLSNVVVSETNGFLVFKIDGTLVPGSSVELFIDADRNQSTGDDGDELWVGVFQEDDGKSYWDADRWNGSKWETVKFDVRAQTFTGREEIGFKAAEAGLSGTFDFVVLSVKKVADAVEGRDRAPDSIVPWSFALAKSSAPPLVLGTPTLSPLRPLAGKPLTVRVPVRTAFGASVTARAVSCSARVKSRVVHGLAAAANGWATCQLTVPKGSSGAIARGLVTIRSGSQAQSKPFSFRIA